MPEILTYNSPPKIEKEKAKQPIFKSFFDYLNSKDKFTKLYIITFALIIIATPFIVNQYLNYRQRAASGPQLIPLTPPPSVIRNGRLFSQGGGWISAVDLTAKTVTVSYLQPAAACSPTFCPKGRPPDVLRQGEVLVINSLDSVENDIIQMKVGNRVTVFFRAINDKTFIPYAVKDFNLLPPNCDPLTKICSGSGSIAPEGITGPNN